MRKVKVNFSAFSGHTFAFINVTKEYFVTQEMRKVKVNFRLDKI